MEKKYEALLIERNIVGTQLVQKNDLLLQKDEQLKLLQLDLDRGARGHNEQLEEIRFLKLEIQKLRHEKDILLSEVNNMTDLRQEIINLERELNHERIRSRALEDLIKTPQNIHRWRKLEDTDPTTMELIEQIHILQKQSLKKTQKIKQLEATLNENETKPKPDIFSQAEFFRLKKSLLDKNEKIKALTTELKIKDELMEHRLNQPIKIINRKNINLSGSSKIIQKERSCESAPVVLGRKLVEKGSSDSKRFLGGGFNLSAKRDH